MKTARSSSNAHRRITHKVPPWLRPKLSTAQVAGLGMATIQNLDALRSGTASIEILLDWTGGSLTWSRIAECMAQRNPAAYGEAALAIADQLKVCTTVINRFKESQLITVTQAEYLIAREAAKWVDALSELVDRTTAVEAANWSDAIIERWMSAAPSASKTEAA